jgi:molecular chaperone GrpE
VTEVNPVDPDADEPGPTGPKVTDKRRLDPVTGAVRDGGATSGASREDVFTEGVDVPENGELPEGFAGDDVHPDTTLAADLTRDLQRLQAEYVNYKKRVDRDRELHRDVAIGAVVEALLPALDDIYLARQHGDLEGGPFAAIADKLEGALARFGVERFGQPGDAFSPMVHEALMHLDAELAEGTEVTTVVQVMQPGYKIGERVIRAARVAVADPETNPQT